MLIDNRKSVHALPAFFAPSPLKVASPSFAVQLLFSSGSLLYSFVVALSDSLLVCLCLSSLSLSEEKSEVGHCLLSLEVSCLLNLDTFMNLTNIKPNQATCVSQH